MQASNQLAIGDKSAGSLTVSNGGAVTADTQSAGNAAVVVGHSSGTTGSLEVTDAGSSFTAVGELQVGVTGAGSLLVQNQATVTTGNAPINTTQGFALGEATGGSGTATVSGNKSLLTNTGEFIVGATGLGSLAIASGGTVTTSPGSAPGLLGADIAANAGSDGSSVSVTGTGSNWQVTGGLVVGDAASGSLAINAGGTVSATTLDIGNQSSGAGNVSVIGASTSLTTTGSLSVGDNGVGELSILNGANVSIGGDFDIGQGASGAGNVDIEDTTGTVFVGGNLNMASSGIAELTVGPNATLQVDNGGVNAGPNATLILFNSIDPVFQSGGNLAIKTTQVQNFPAYVKGATFSLSQSVSYTLNTPVIESSIFNIGTVNSKLLLNANTVDAASTINFADATGTFVVGIDQLATIDLPASGTGPFTAEANPNQGLPLIGGFQGIIAGFQVGDAIVVDTTQAATFSQSGSIISVIANSSTLGVLTFDTAAHATLAFATPGALEDQVAPCFVAGTRISTERGEVAVEDLCEGDRVQVVLGGPAEPVVWVGHRTLDCSRHPQPRKVWPVRISAGAFGPHRPWRDLWLSPDHAVYIGDVLIPVKHLVNGSSIVQVPREMVTYYHVELAAHSVLLAEGLAAESYLDIGDRSSFANGGGVLALYPDFASRVWDAEGCAPLVVTGAELDTARRWVNGLASRAGSATQAA